MANIQNFKLFTNQDITVGTTSAKVSSRNYDSYVVMGSATAGTGDLKIQASVDGIQWFTTLNSMTVSAGQDIYGTFTNDTEFIRVYSDTDLSGCTLIASMREHY